MERSREQQSAIIGGLKLRVEEMSRSNPDDENLEDILKLKGKQIENQLKEINEYRTKLELLEKELTSSKKF
jgi:arsenate reductase-like glutaredoxin family protein